MSSKVTIASRIPLALTTAALLALAVVSAHAEDQVRSETVRFPDLNVDTPAGAQALYGRIHAAAKRVCSDDAVLPHLAAQSCARKAEARAVAQLALPQLTAYFQMKTGVEPQPLIANR